MVHPIASGNAALSPDALHRYLASSHTARLAPAFGVNDWERLIADEYAARKLEREFVEAERASIATWVKSVPKSPRAFVEWFEALKEEGPGQGDPLFPWLAERATRDEMCWFLSQEMAGEAGFDDLVALTQVKLPARPKLEMARNYWDEMGQGNQGGMHGPMLDALAQALSLSPRKDIVWQSLALGNLMVALATARHYAYQSVGALGAIELTAPGRAELVNQGLRRIGIGGAARKYFALHATIDIRHSQAWNREVLFPLVESNPALAAPIAEGALLRLKAGARCFDRYRSELWRKGSIAPRRTRPSLLRSV